MDGITQDLVLGSAILLLPLLGLAWLIWRRRPAAPTPEPEPAPLPDMSDDAPTYSFEAIRSDERRRLADEAKAATPAPSRPAWLPPVSRARQRRWDEQSRHVGSEDRG